METANNSSISSHIKKLDGALFRFETWITVICFALMCVIVIAGIVMRFILQIPNKFGEEISRYLMICGVFVGVSIGVRQKAHLGVTMFVDRLPPFLSKIVYILAAVISIAAYIALTVFSFQFVNQMKSYGQTSPAMGLPMWIIYFTVSAGLILSAFRAVLVFLNDHVFREKILPEEKREEAL